MKKLIAIFCLTLAVFGLGAGVVFAENSEPKKIVTVGQDTIVDHDFFAMGDVVTISGIVNGDVYAMGEKVIVDGTVNGDLIGAGGIVEVTGTVTQDARVGAGELYVSGDVLGSLTAGGGQIEIDDDAKIGKSVVLGAGTLRIDGSVERGATIGAGDVVLNNYIGQSAKIGAGTLTISENAKINGDLNYWSENDATIRNRESVTGSVTKHATGDKDSRKDAGKLFAGAWLFWKVISFLAMFILGFALLKLAPVVTWEVVKTYKDKPFASFGLGILALILAPIIFVLLLISMIGIPFAVFLAFGVIVMLIVSKVFIALFVGHYLKTRFKLGISDTLSLALGLLVWGVLSHLPIVGGILSFIGVVSALGAIIIAKKSYYKMLSSKKLI